MPRHLNLRQIEAFQAIMSHGTVSRGAEFLNISQPAMSKLIAHLEGDTGLTLFDRVKGRLVPTEHAMRLHDEVDRIFAGVRQVESAVAAIRREEQGRVMVGVMPALAGSFIARATTDFLQTHSNVFCTITPFASQRIIDRLVARDLDIGLVSSAIDNPYVTAESLMDHPLVCIMPPDHPLAESTCIEPDDLRGVPFVSFSPASYARSRIDDMFERYRIEPNITLVSGGAPTLCEFVSAGIGISLVHPLMASGFERRLAVRPFRPEISYKFLIARNADSRNGRLIEQFAENLRLTAARLSESILAGSGL